MEALRLNCLKEVLITPQKSLSNRKVVELKTLDISDHMNTGSTI